MGLNLLNPKPYSYKSSYSTTVPQTHTLSLSYINLLTQIYHYYLSQTLLFKVVKQYGYVNTDTPCITEELY